MREKVKIRLLQNILKEITLKYDEFIEQQQAILELTYERATKDLLTRLYNRCYFFDFVRKALSRVKRKGEKAVLIFLDLDNFKYVNDHYGHRKGDEVLRQVARFLRSHFRDYDIIARFGGDEFIAYVETSDIESVKKRLKELEGEIERRFSTYKISISYGLSIFPDDGKDIKELIEVADKRMYDYKWLKKHST